MSLSALLAEWPDAPVTACKGCGKKILVAQTQDGKTIPLDPSPPVYAVTLFETTDEKPVYWASQAGMVFVSHFATCQFASKFSGAKKR